MKTYQVQWIVAALAVTGLNAQGTKPAGNPPPPPPPPPLLLPVLDTDKDGELSATEIENASAALGELDKNGDGNLTRKEIMPPPPKGAKPGQKPTGTPPPPTGGTKPQGPPPPTGGTKPQGPPPPPPGSPVLLHALDLDGDGELSASEIEDAPLSLKALDKDGDGSISKKEMKPGKVPVKDPT